MNNKFFYITVKDINTNNANKIKLTKDLKAYKTFLMQSGNKVFLLENIGLDEPICTEITAETFRLCKNGYLKIVSGKMFFSMLNSCNNSNTKQEEYF